MKRELTILSVVLLLAGCMVEEVAVENVPGTVSKTFSASLEPETRTSLTIEGAVGKIRWAAGDSISILDGTSNVKVVLTDANLKDGGAKAVFTADVAPAATYYAVYPYSADNSIVDGVPVTVRPSAKQDGTFGANHIAVGEFVSSSSSFILHNTVAVLSFTQDAQDIAYVSFGSLDGIYIYDKVPAVEVTTGRAGTFHFCLPEFSLQNGFAFKAFDSDNHMRGMYVNHNEFSVKANQGMVFGKLEDHYMSVLSLAEFKALDGNDKNPYIVSGAITGILEDESGDFHISDGTDTLTIHGLLTPDGKRKEQFRKSDLKIGDVVTVYGTKDVTDGTVGISDAHYISHSLATHEYLFGQQQYGIYSEGTGKPILVYRVFTDQIGMGKGYFRFVDPNGKQWLSVTGLPSNPSVGKTYTFSVEQNYSDEVPLVIKKEMTVGKIEKDAMFGIPGAKKVWFYNRDGMAYIFRLP